VLGRDPAHGDFDARAGNPGGRPKVLAELRDLARQHTPAAMRELARLSTKGKKEEVRLKAIEMLLDRGWGKVVPIGGPIIPAEDGAQNVVRTPYPCQSVEEW